MKKIVLIFLFFQSFYGVGQSVRIPVSSIYTRLSAYSISSIDAFSFVSNQAALANMHDFTVGVFGERRFMLQDLALYQMALAVPIKWGQFGVTGNYFGGIDNKETSIGLAYGRKLTDNLDVGAQFNYYTFQINGYGSASSINFEAGFLFHITPQFHFGIHTYNPTGSNLGKDGTEKLPAIYTAGIGYETSDKFLISGEIQKQENEPINVNAGLQYSFKKQLFARVGMNSSASTYYLGVGVLLKSFRLDVTASVHPQLGISPGLMLIYKGVEKQE